MSNEAQATSRAPGGEPAAGSRIGRYLVLGRQGGGAAGEVLAAYDPELDRKVAIRRLRPSGVQSGAEQEQRRLRAVQALARLSDPHVAAVHDVGLHDGRVFVAMELVEGRTLGAWLSAARRSWPQVLEVMAQAGRGLAAAHAQGLAHGDFGPDAVTIAHDGSARVTDLGLARAIDGGSGEDGRSERIAADLLAFCTCLADALSRVSRVPRWLRRAIDRGLAADPARRWPSMPALLDALERGGARARRRRGLVVLALVAATGVGALGWQWHAEVARVRACEAEGASIEAVWSDEGAAAVHEALLATGVPQAASTAERVRPWLAAQARAWQDARTEACLQARVRGTWSEDAYERAQWCLDERRMELEALVDELRGADAQALDRAVPAAASLGSVEPCVDPSTLARLPTPPDEQREAVRALRAELSRAGALHQTGAFDEGLAVAEAALARARAQGWPPAIAAAALAAGLLHDAKGEHASAEPLLEEAYFTGLDAGAYEVAVASAVALVYVVGVMLERPEEGLEWARHHDLVLARLPDPAELRRSTVLGNVAGIHRAQGDYAAAEAGLREVLRIRERALGPDHPSLGITLNNLANLQQAAGAPLPAKALLERALALQERALGPDHPLLATALNNLGNLHHATGATASAIVLLERAIVLLERARGPEHPQLASALNNLGNVLQGAGELARAQALHERALAIRRKVLGSDHPDVALSLLNLSNVLVDRGELAAARERREEALMLQERRLGAQHPALAVAVVGLAEVLLEQGSPAAAILLAERALRLHAAGGVEPRLAASARLVLARATWDMGGDRAHAVALAEAARAELRAAGEAKTLAEVERWLADHAEARP